MDMNFITFKKIVNEVSNHKLDGLWLYNIGESMIHPEFFEMLVPYPAVQFSNIGVGIINADVVEMNKVLFKKDLIRERISHIQVVHFKFGPLQFQPASERRLCESSLQIKPARGKSPDMGRETAEQGFHHRDIEILSDNIEIEILHLVKRIIQPIQAENLIRFSGL